MPFRRTYFSKGEKYSFFCWSFLVDTPACSEKPPALPASVPTSSSCAGILCNRYNRRPLCGPTAMRYVIVEPVNSSTTRPLSVHLPDSYSRHRTSRMPMACCLLRHTTTAAIPGTMLTFNCLNSSNTDQPQPWVIRYVDP